jgi:GGDEF domain-containing protein
LASEPIASLHDELIRNGRRTRTWSFASAIAVTVFGYMIGRAQTLRQLATTDPLTNLLNRRAIENRLESEWRGAPIRSAALAPDDRSRRLQARERLGGHAAGDRVLRAAAQRFEARCVEATTGLAGVATSS